MHIFVTNILVRNKQFQHNQVFFFILMKKVINCRLERIVFLKLNKILINAKCLSKYLKYIVKKINMLTKLFLSNDSSLMFSYFFFDI